MSKQKCVAVLDTGYDCTHSCSNVINGFTLEIKGDSIFINEDYTDNIGHGTAVVRILDKLVTNCEIVVIKFDEKYCKRTGVSDWLVYALEYILHNNRYDVINMSIGAHNLSNIATLEYLCNKITNTGTYIVAAFDNNGINSYPACFSNVIGVDSSPFIPKNKYVFMGSCRNILMPEQIWHLGGISDQYSAISGNSFIAPKVSSMIINLLNANIPPSDIINRLNDSALSIQKHPSSSNLLEKRVLNIHNAVVYPYNKEVTALARFEHMLNFNIVGYFNEPVLGNVGVNVGDILSCNNCDSIKSIRSLDWSSCFDTVILSHTNMLSNLIGHSVVADVIKKCLKFKKNLYLFDEDTVIDSMPFSHWENEFANNGVWIRRPEKNSNVQTDLGVKLYDIGCPVLCVAGTDSSQGKYTLQLKLRKLLREEGVNACNFGTEPTSELFGFEGYYTFGYGASLPLEGWKNIVAINHTLHQIEKYNPDLIITGSQSRTVTPQVAAFKSYPIKQQEFFVACAADTYILCINASDSLKYIKRSINYLESIYPSKVIAICINDALIKVGHLRKLFIKIRNYVMTLRYTFYLTQDNELKKLIHRIIKYYR